MKGLSALIDKYEPKNENEKTNKTIEENINKVNNRSISKEKTDRENKFKTQSAKVLLRVASPTPNITKKPINSPKNNDANIKKTEELLETFYNNLGHYYFTKILKIFEKYCYFGKINTSFEMDFSQFVTFMTQNSMYDKTLDKTYCELIFNKIKGQNKCKIYFIFFSIEF